MSKLRKSSFIVILVVPEYFNDWLSNDGPGGCFSTITLTVKAHGPEEAVREARYRADISPNAYGKYGELWEVVRVMHGRHSRNLTPCLFDDDFDDHSHPIYHKKPTTKGGRI